MEILVNTVPYLGFVLTRTNNRDSQNFTNTKTIITRAKS